jgi:hypothetical protein
MSRSATVLLVIATICLTAAVTVFFAPVTPDTLAPNLTPLWLLGFGTALAAILVDTDTARERLAILRPHAHRNAARAEYRFARRAEASRTVECLPRERG